MIWLFFFIFLSDYPFRMVFVDSNVSRVNINVFDSHFLETFNNIPASKSTSEGGNEMP